MIEANDLALFQGDSITDADRSRQNTEANDRLALGSGYAGMAAARLLAERPADELKFLNRGISGSQVIHLADRWPNDCINLSPDVLSILIGINDTWRCFDGGVGVPVEKYRQGYHDLLTDTREALPNVKLVLCEPFILRCGVVTEEWHEQVADRQKIVAEFADEFDARLVPFQKLFDEASERVGPTYWAKDGVHPTAAGHALMADCWLKTVCG